MCREADDAVEALATAFGADNEIHILSTRVAGGHHQAEIRPHVPRAYIIGRVACRLGRRRFLRPFLYRRCRWFTVSSRRRYGSGRTHCLGDQPLRRDDNANVRNVDGHHARFGAGKHAGEPVAVHEMHHVGSGTPRRQYAEGGANLCRQAH